jgi:hypothetical protein
MLNERKFVIPNELPTFIFPGRPTRSRISEEDTVADRKIDPSPPETDDIFAWVVLSSWLAKVERGPLFVEPLNRILKKRINLCPR